MKKYNPLLLLSIFIVAACGGGGSESGLPDTVDVTPRDIQFTGLAGLCAVGAGPTVFVHGGRPPYKLFNTHPTAIQLSSEYILHSGEGFDVNFTGQCFESIPIMVEDSLGQLGKTILTNKRAS